MVPSFIGLDVEGNTDRVSGDCLLIIHINHIHCRCLASHETNPKLLVSFAVFVIAFLFLMVIVPLSVCRFNHRVSPNQMCNEPQGNQKYSLGGCTIDGVSPGRALIMEFFCTFVVVFIVVTIAFDKRRSKEIGLSMVCAVVVGAMALAVFVLITGTGKAGCTGVGLNPTRFLVPSLLLGGSLWDGHWIFWIGPCFTCVI
ncbi:Calcium-binding EF-hand family protein [Hibiscus syriacus]|uniref:Calcium-binding EF-hand family protein n=1 Tax=Hibiscus syriacus TaxID=106335 RepID=A0A6A2YPE9_HIBSY|nr:Calcium-binding EF-hand family protein [Hibiscus syriacus]